MAGTVTTTGSDYSHNIKKFVMNWTSDAAGAADLITTEKFTGRLLSAQHVPDGGGTAPTDLYDVTVLNSYGLDILAGTGANIAIATGKSSQSSAAGVPLPSIVDSTLTLGVTNAGNAKSGKVVIYFTDI